MQKEDTKNWAILIDFIEFSNLDNGRELLKNTEKLF